MALVQPQSPTPRATAIVRRTTAFFLLLPLAVSAALIRVDSRSQGRTFLVDTDRPQIRKALRDVAAPSPAGSIPEWLPPFPGAAMLNYAHSTPLESSARDDFPAWDAVYPGAKVVVAAGPPAGWQPQKFIDMRTYNMEMETPSSVAQVAVFYRDTMTGNGLKIERETQSQAWSYSLAARTPDRTHLVNVDILKRPKETFVRLTDHYTLPRP